MALLNTYYRINQRYYADFKQLPLHGSKKYQHFRYKPYKNGTDDIDHVFDSLGNAETVDNVYIVSMNEKLLKEGNPLTHRLFSEIQFLQENLTALQHSGCYEITYLLQFISDVQSLQNVLICYFKDVQKKLSDAFELLLKDTTTPALKIHSDDVGNVVSLIRVSREDFQESIDILNDFLSQKPLYGQDLRMSEKTCEAVRTFVIDLQRFSQLQYDLMRQLKGWQQVRAIHEKQELFN